MQPTKERRIIELGLKSLRNSGCTLGASFRSVL